MRRTKTVKKSSLFVRFIYANNVFFAVLLLLAYLASYVSPGRSPMLSVFGLCAPILIIINIFFLLFWLFKRSKKLRVSLLVLLLGFNYLSSFYKIADAKSDEKGLKVMSYNVRLFNKYEWIKNGALADEMLDFIEDKAPDIICFQEFYFEKEKSFPSYPYRHVVYRSRNKKMGQAIYSKYPIVGSGSLDFKETANNVIYADIVYKKDTIRTYNLHLESLHINIKKELGNQASSLYFRMRSSFLKQQKQQELFMEHKEKSTFKTIICSDLNNTQFSYVYSQIEDRMTDAFVEKGEGFGKTFDFEYFPMRIDFIFADKELRVLDFTRYKERYSDHFPIMAKYSLSNK